MGGDRIRFAWLFLLIGLIAALAGCGSAPMRPEPERQATLPGAPGAPQRPGRGGYYKDDGPGDNPPDIRLIEDAEPRSEPLHRFANNPYTVDGRSYTPMRSIAPFRQRGTGSWYGRRFNGQATSSGERYDMYGMTAAHPTLPIPSYAKVTNLQNGRSVVVRVNDRGPFHSERVIDLSWTAAAKLGYADRGSAQLEVELIQVDDMPQYAHRGRPAVLAAARPAADAAPRAPSLSIISAAQAAEPAAGASPVYLQLGAFSQRENAEALRLRVARELDWLTEFVQINERAGGYRVQVGPYRSRIDAASAADRIRDALKISPVVVGPN